MLAFKNSNLCKSLPRKSPVLKKIDKVNDYGENDDDRDIEEPDHNEHGVGYSNKQRKNVFELRVFNGKLNETQDEAVSTFKKTMNEGDIFNVLSAGINDVYRDTPDEGFR
jgi:hypothetical protein